MAPNSRRRTAAPGIRIERLRDDIAALARIGRGNDGGLHRISFSDADLEARRWLMERLRELAIEPFLDGAANVRGRLGDGDAAAVLVGSHLDSVPGGGHLDGALGVLAGLECLRVLREHDVALGRPVELVATSEEEGRFGGMFGAQTLTGAVTREWLESAEDETGQRLTDAMRAQGLDPYAALEAGLKPGSVAAFLELHIEQGPVLEASSHPIGIVEAIAGVFNWTVRLTGRANHSGTTPMHMRQDAVVGLADVVQAIPGIIDEAGTHNSRITVGKVDVRPNFPHTVAGEVDFSIVGREIDEHVLQSLAHGCRRAIDASAARNGLERHIVETSWLEPSPCHPDIVRTFREEAESMGVDALIMASGAGHDTQVMAGLTRAGMIFVPSIGGVSHAPREDTAWADIETGANLLLRAIVRLAGTGDE